MRYDTPERSLFEALSFTNTLCVFISYPLNIVQAYLHSKHNIAVPINLTPVLLKVKKNNKFSKRLEAGLLQNSVCVKPISFKCNCVRFGTFFA